MSFQSPPILIYRIGNYFHRIGFKRFSLLISWLNRFLFSTWIPSSSTIGKNFKAGYWGLGIVIHNNVKIGDNCTIGQNVTIGRNFGDNKVPRLGNNIYIGAGSAIFGEISIGDNVIIGANSLVNKTIPPNTIWAGNPAKRIRELKCPYWELDLKKDISE